MRKGHTVLTLNRAQCKSCKDIITSEHNHDFRACSCFTGVEGNKGIFIDGGLDYVRRGGCLENFIDMSEWESEKK